MKTRDWLKTALILVLATPAIGCKSFSDEVEDVGEEIEDVGDEAGDEIEDAVDDID